MTDVELLCEALELNKIEDLNKELTRAGKNHSTARDVLMKEVCGFTYFFIGLLVQDPFTCMFIFTYGCVIVCVYAEVDLCTCMPKNFWNVVQILKGKMFTQNSCNEGVHFHICQSPNTGRRNP